MGKNLKYWIAFSLFSKIGPTRFKRLRNYFPNMREAWNASAQELKRAGLEENIVREFVGERKKIDPDFELEKVNKAGVNVATINDPVYPKLLKEIYDPPFLLYYKGNLSKEDEFSLSVVGSRKFSFYGKEVTNNIIRELALNKITIVSGLALGIDALSHQATLRAKGKTIAVLGNGLDRVYPISNSKLADEIVSSFGALISEFPLGTPPMKHHFPQRNRIISGLSLGTLVVEAGKESGALITAKCALEQNREIFAVPGNIYSETSQGTNHLIKMGAKPITQAADILDALNLTQVATFVENKKIIPETKEILLKFLSREPVHVDRLAELSKLNIATVNSTLTMMEMKGKTRNLGGNNYVVAR